MVLLHGILCSMTYELSWLHMTFALGRSYLFDFYISSSS